MRKTDGTNLPYRHLGVRLKRLRHQYKRTLAEVCGAVEIDENVLSKIEAGEIRPAEDILEQLMNHYNIDGSAAQNLWSMAGYDADDLLIEDMDPLLSQNLTKHIIMIVAQEQKTLYSDSLDIHYDDNGLILNFKQIAGQSQPVSLAKLGMSYEQSEKVLATLQRVLLRHKYLKGPKSLPRGKTKA